MPVGKDDKHKACLIKMCRNRILISCSGGLNVCIYIYISSEKISAEPGQSRPVVYAKKWIRIAHTTKDREMFVGPNEVWLREECSLGIPSASSHRPAPLLLDRSM